MIQKTEFDKMRKAMVEYDAARDKLIVESRGIIHLSKEVIYAVHRNDLASALAAKTKMEKEFAEVIAKVKKYPALYHSGTTSAMVQEYVEAVCYYEIVKNKKLPTAANLKLDPEAYLLGLCDLVGELSRRAVNSVIKGNYEEAIFIKEFVESLHAEFMLMDLRNSDLRRKSDGIKYELKKLENLVLELKLKGKI